MTVTPDGGTYGVEVINDADEWVPAEVIPAPMHHDTRLEWSNVELLGPAAPGRRHVTLTVESRDIEKVPEYRAWDTTVRARITAVCTPRAPLRPGARVQDARAP